MVEPQCQGHIFVSQGETHLLSVEPTNLVYFCFVAIFVQTTGIQYGAFVKYGHISLPVAAADPVTAENVYK